MAKHRDIVERAAAERYGQVHYRRLMMGETVRSWWPLWLALAGAGLFWWTQPSAGQVGAVLIGVAVLIALVVIVVGSRHRSKW